MNWLTQTIITMTPLSLMVLLFAAAAFGWIVYGLRGYKHWYKRFHRYHILPSKRRMKRNYGYVEYVPEVINQPLMRRPQARAPQIIDKQQTSSHQQKAVYSTKDDLRVIEGIGPKIESVLNNNGIYTWRELAQTPEENLKAMLERNGLAMHSPSTWAQQAHMAQTGQWTELKKYQDTLTSAN